MVKAMLEDLIAVVVDVEKFGTRVDRPKKKWNTCKQRHTGRFELLEPARRRREEKCPKIRKEVQQLGIQGTAVPLRRPKRGECPRGPGDRRQHRGGGCGRPRGGGGRRRRGARRE